MAYLFSSHRREDYNSPLPFLEQRRTSEGKSSLFPPAADAIKPVFVACWRYSRSVQYSWPGACLMDWLGLVTAMWLTIYTWLHTPISIFHIFPTKHGRGPREHFKPLIAPTVLCSTCCTTALDQRTSAITSIRPFPTTTPGVVQLS